MSRSPEPPSRWPKPPRSRPLALRPEDFEPSSRPLRLGSADLQRRMDGWAGGVVDRLADLSIEAATSSTEHDKERDASIEASAPTLASASWPVVRFVVRGAAPDATRLVLAMDAARVRAGLELPAAQVRTARARLSDPARALELATALEALPEQFTMGVSGDRAAAEAPRATADDVRALLDRVEREQATMWIGWSVPRELAVEHAVLLDEQLADAIVALARVFTLLGAEPGERADTRRDHDASSGSKGRRFSGRRGSADVPRRDDDERAPGRTARSRGRGRDRDRESERETEAEPEPAGESPVSRGRALDAKLPPRPSSRLRPSSKSLHVVIERGARVEVLQGPFSGKVGVVHELDGKGGARVMLGLLAVRIEVGNLVPAVEGRGRPRLSSSHRKPIPARS
jgi:hypothetical protein